MKLLQTWTNLEQEKKIQVIRKEQIEKQNEGI